jgi:hypothetical protein
MDFVRKGSWRYAVLKCTLCGTKKEVRIDVFNRLNKENKVYCCVICSSSTKAFKHGFSLNIRNKINADNWLYRRWQAMKKRCVMYESYVARGIKVCEEWDKNFLAFKSWAEANGADPKLELDRKNNDLGYAPDNCRWVTHKENCRRGGRSGKFSISE